MAKTRPMQVHRVAFDPAAGHHVVDIVFLSCDVRATVPQGDGAPVQLRFEGPHPRRIVGLLRTLPATLRQWIADSGEIELATSF